MRRRPRIQHRIDPPIQIVQHMRRRRRADVPKEVRARRSHRNPARRISSSATGCAGIRTPTSGRPAVTASGTAAERGSSSVSGPGQNAFISRRAALRNIRNQPVKHRLVRDMDNHRIPRRPLLRRKDPLHRSRIQRIRPQPIDRLGWQRHQPADAKNLRRAVQRLIRFGAIHQLRIHGQS